MPDLSHRFRAPFKVFDCSLLPRQATGMLEVCIKVKRTAESKTNSFRHAKLVISRLTVTKPTGHPVSKQATLWQTTRILSDLAM
jgi:hypothetical protein